MTLRVCIWRTCVHGLSMAASAYLRPRLSLRVTSFNRTRLVDCARLLSFVPPRPHSPTTEFLVGGHGNAPRAHRALLPPGHPSPQAVRHTGVFASAAPTAEAAAHAAARGPTVVQRAGGAEGRRRAGILLSATVGPGGAGSGAERGTLLCSRGRPTGTFVYGV